MCGSSFQDGISPRTHTWPHKAHVSEQDGPRHVPGSWQEQLKHTRLQCVRDRPTLHRGFRVCRSSLYAAPDGKSAAHRSLTRTRRTNSARAYAGHASIDPAVVTEQARRQAGSGKRSPTGPNLMGWPDSRKGIPHPGHHEIVVAPRIRRWGRTASHAPMRSRLQAAGHARASRQGKKRRGDPSSRDGYGHRGVAARRVR